MAASSTSTFDAAAVLGLGGERRAGGLNKRLGQVRVRGVDGGRKAGKRRGPGPALPALETAKAADRHTGVGGDLLLLSPRPPTRRLEHLPQPFGRGAFRVGERCASRVPDRLVDLVVIGALTRLRRGRTHCARELVL